MTGKPSVQYNIRFLPDNIIVKGSSGESILKTALKAGIHLSTTCGGSGTCGSCRIIVREGQLDSAYSDTIPEDEFKSGVRLACQSYISGDVTVEVVPNTINPEEPAASRTFYLPESLPAINPLVCKLVIKLPVPTPEDNSPDLKRLKYSLKNLGYNNICIDYDALKTIPEVVRDQNWEVTATIIRSSPAPLLSRLESGDTSADNYGIVFDIGTTAVRGRLIALENGKILAEETTYNRQRDYGDDVISRIAYCHRPGGIEALQRLTTDTLNKLIENMTCSAGIENENVSLVVIAANTIMVQLLLAINPEPLRLSPYVPAVNSLPLIKADRLGINLGKHCYVNIIPVVASYVGGDIVAGVTACSMHNREQTSLYIDIGTNGEIVLGKRDWVVTAACSAGPTFEGGGIKYGMLAINGAIEGFELPNPFDQPLIKVIGNKSPAGICGSGLINAISALFSAGILGQNGKFNSESACKRLRQGEDGFEYIIVEAQQTSIGKDIVLTEVDVDNFVRSKAAIYAGCQTLAESIGIDMSEIDNIIIAGTFGSHIDIDNAIKVGLLPDIARDKFQFIGNGSLMGAYSAILSLEMYQDMLKIADTMTSIELSENRLFMDNYVASLFLPHTDMSRFPSIITWH